MAQGRMMQHPMRLELVLLYTVMKNRNTSLKKSLSLLLLLFLGVKAFKVWETDGGRQRQTAILTHKFFWPYHAVLFSRSYLALHLLLSRGYSIGSRCRPLTQRGALSHCKLDLIYQFITPTISDQPRDCFRLFTQMRPVQRNLWFTARSRANILQFV